MELGDSREQAHAHHSLASVTHGVGHDRDVLRHARHALDLYRMAGHRVGEAWALNAVGWYQSLLGDHRLAISYCQQALDLHRELGDGTGQADAWDGVGHAQSSPRQLPGGDRVLQACPGPVP